MNQDEILRALTRHLDALERSVELGLVLALVFAWAGIHKEDTIAVFSVHVQRAYAFHVACIAYSALNIVVTERFIRIGDMLRLLDGAYALSGVTALFVHPWSLNPFAQFGSTGLSRFNSAKGFGLLIVVWWLCLSSLYPFLERADTKEARLFQVAFFAIGVVSIFAITRSLRILGDTIEKHVPVLASDFSRVNRLRIGLTFAGFAIGGLISYGFAIM